MLASVIVLPPAVWLGSGESFLASTIRTDADILVVEGWIGIRGITEAKAEFDGGQYHYVVTTGSQTPNRWGYDRWDYATIAKNHLVRLGVPREKIIVAPAGDTETQRTFSAATAVARCLQDAKLAPHVNVFTVGAHARRSRLVYQRVLGAEARVGVIAGKPHPAAAYWWHSSERSQNFLKETFAYAFELLAGSGRFLTREPRHS